ncbi:MAG: hypothetical protein WBO70_03595 [Erysipelotrichaceae bacterium]
MLDYIVILITAIVEMVMIMFMNKFPSPTIAWICIIALPTIVCAALYYKNRYYHFRHIYTEEELEKQNRGSKK